MAPELAQFARTVERAVWRELIREHSARVVAATGRTTDFLQDTLRWKATKPSAAQLGSLRNALIEAHSGDANARLTQWRLQVLGGNSRLEGKIQKWNTDQLEALGTLFEHPETVWGALGAARWPVLVSGDSTGLREELWLEALQALLLRAIRMRTRMEDSA
jgi:hypothetical protein